MEQTINSYYTSILRRKPNAAEIEEAKTRLDAAENLKQELEEFAAELLEEAGEVRSIMRVYQAIFDRTADSGGLDFWTARFRDVMQENDDYGNALVATLQNWLNSNEFVERFGDDLSNEDFLTLLYKNILDRDFDQDGFDYWLGRLNEGMDRERLVIDFSESAEFMGQVDGRANNVLQVAAELASDTEVDDPIVPPDAPDDYPYSGKLTDNIAPVILPGDVDEAIAEGSDDLSASGILFVNDPDRKEGDAPLAASYAFKSAEYKDSDGNDKDLSEQQTAAINPDGAFSLTAGNGMLDWKYNIEESAINFLAAEETITLTFTVTVADDQEGTATQDVTITITGTNDAAVIGAESVTAGAVTEDDAENASASGNLDHTDVDGTDDAWKAMEDTSDYGTFTIDAAGAWSYTLNDESDALHALAADATLEDIFTAMTEDGTEQTVTITITGTNDAPVITADVVEASIKKGSEDLSASGSLSISDVDQNDADDPVLNFALKSAVLNDAKGKAIGAPTEEQQSELAAAFALQANSDSNDVDWNFMINNDMVDFLGDDETVTLTFTVNVDDGKGGIAAEDITIMIRGPETLDPLTPGRDLRDGTDGDDIFEAPVVQNSALGGVSNTLATGDEIDGLGGTDRLNAVVTNEFVGSSIDRNTEITPTIINVEEIYIESSDSDDRGGGVTLDAKKISGHVEIGSFHSDGNLVIENLTTLANDGTTKRSTSEITITMDHTDNDNSDNDASDLTVYFDDNYLVRDQTRASEARFYLRDQDADEAGQPPLENINVTGIIFTWNGEEVELQNAAARENGGTYESFVDALQAPLQTLIDDGTLPEGTTLTLDPSNTRPTFLSNGNRVDVPSILLTLGEGGTITRPDFFRPETIIGDFNIFGRRDANNTTTPDPISVNIDLEKVGRGGEGGGLLVGAKSQDRGIEVFDVNVRGGDDKPSDLEYLETTNRALRVINIRTEEDTDGNSGAALTIRNNVDELPLGIRSSAIERINADGFVGNLSLGNDFAFVNVDEITAMGGGNVAIFAAYDGSGDYSISTGDGQDRVNLQGDLSQADAVTVDVGSADDRVEYIVQRGDFAVDLTVNGGAGDDRFQLVKGTTDDDQRAVVRGVELNDIEVLEVTNRDDHTNRGFANPDPSFANTNGLIDLSGFIVSEDSADLVFDASSSETIDRVVVSDSESSVIVRDLQEQFWTDTPADPNDEGALVELTNITAHTVHIDSAADSKTGKDGEIVFELNDAIFNRLRITENAIEGDNEQRAEQVGTITLRATGVPSAIGDITNGSDRVSDVPTTHTLNIEVSDLTGSSPPENANPAVSDASAQESRAAIDFFAGQFIGLGAGLAELRNVNIDGGGDVYLNFAARDTDAKRLTIEDGDGSSFFSFADDGFRNIRLDGGDGFDTLIVDWSDVFTTNDSGTVSIQSGVFDNIENIERIEVYNLPASVGVIDVGRSGAATLLGTDQNDFLDASEGGAYGLFGNLGRDIFVVGASENNSLPAFRREGFDNDKIPDDSANNVLADRQFTPGTDGPDAGAENVVYILDAVLAQNDALVFRKTNGELEKAVASAQNTKINEDSDAATRDDADQLAVAAFLENTDRLYYIDERTVDDAFEKSTDDLTPQIENDGVVLNDAVFAQVEAAFAAISNGNRNQPIELATGQRFTAEEVAEAWNAAQRENWVRIYYNEPGTDAAPDAVAEMFGFAGSTEAARNLILGSESPLVSDLEPFADKFEYSNLF